MPSLTVPSLTYIGQQITMYGGVIVVVAGVLGGLLNMIVFLSLKTFRESSCAFYLTVMSLVNIVELLLAVLSRTMISGFGIDWTAMSLPFCKIRLSISHVCGLISYTCMSLATIDQYLATCTRPHWQQWCNIHIAQRLVLIFTSVWCLQAIPYFIFQVHVTSANTGIIICTITNDMMARYRNYVVPLFLTGYIPDFITVLFGILAYRNIQQISYRTVPLVRRELDKQLTRMVLVQVVINVFTNVPSVTMNAIMYATSNINNPMASQIIQFIYTVTLVIFYTYFASSFYIYMCVSERFRRQFIYVLFDIHLSRWRQQRTFNNQVLPE